MTFLSRSANIALRIRGHAKLGLASWKTPGPIGRPSVEALSSTSPSLQQLRFKKTRQPLYSESNKEKEEGNRSNKAGRAVKKPVVSASLNINSLLEATEAKMGGSVEWYAKQVSMLESRASGRIGPSIIESVKVPNLIGDVRYKLREVASIGVKEGSTLIVTVYDEQMLKLVERALFDARIQGVAPQIVNENTIRVPMPKPTVELRDSFVQEAAKIAEVTRGQVRQARGAGMESLKEDGIVDKNSSESKKLQTLCDKYIKRIDDILKEMKQSVQRA